MPEVNMPRLSDTMEEGTITRWLKKPGDEVKRGDILAEVETDKANMEIEAYDNGVLEQISVHEGEAAPIGQVIATIGSGAGAAAKQQPTATKQEARPEVKQEVGAGAKAAPAQATAAQTSTVSAAPAPDSETSRHNGTLKVSPLARRMAEEHSIDLASINGSGPGGRIVRDDIEDYLDQQRQATPAQPTAPAPQITATGAQPADSEVVKLTQMQKTVARRLTESKQTVPHFYVSTEIDMTAALELRQKLNAALSEEGVKISVNDMIVRAAALALEKFPEVNSSYVDSQFLRHQHINIGMAVDVPGGLLVPVLRDVNSKGLRTIARESKALIEKARAGKLVLTDFQGGTFSISNLGMMDVSDFIPVINPPEAAILAVASTRKTFVPVDGQPVLRDIMKVTVSADHRIIYGATVARFLQEVKRLLQNVYLLLS
ncbi:MAG TPA: dihydrolipoamide acetyltransferase family protein [Ktedonobacteraceae bacterium]|jgi:pyruvate dehydrogenase E2 component (dihydrolipoamide acetyltransferase)|nr:dihydrolipoamide acetyltransferase family protein [Ktedonobacteraceae bacterium]